MIFKFLIHDAFNLGIFLFKTSQAIVTTPVGADGKSRELAILLANRFPILLFQYLIILEELATLLANRFPVSN